MSGRKPKTNFALSFVILEPGLFELVSQTVRLHNHAGITNLQLGSTEFAGIRDISP